MLLLNMIISKTISSLRNEIQSWRDQGLSIAFVPTMGHLHSGHIALVNAASEKCDRVVVSIFVNPLQFNEASDFSAYPVTLEDDQQKLVEAEADLLYLPTTDQMYPQGQEKASKVAVPEISDELEGACRPGHFDGVATVVLKLFNQVQPDVAFFGEKDYQQLLLVQKMVRDLDLDIEINSVSTYRESDGLAMSSRNSRLTEKQRLLAPELYRQLKLLSEQLKSGSTEIEKLEKLAKQQLKNAGFEPEYISVRDCSSLLPADNKTSNRIVLGAAKIGDIRLIDNIIVD